MTHVMLIKVNISNLMFTLKKKKSNFEWSKKYDNLLISKNILFAFNIYEPLVKCDQLASLC